MRLNQYLAKHTALSRRSADQAIAEGRVTVSGQPAIVGSLVNQSDTVLLDNHAVSPTDTVTIALYKPVKTICSRRQQGNVPTIYSLLPNKLQHLSYVGRLDKDTTGLLFMSNDGQFMQAISHPRHAITKRYQVELDRPLNSQDQTQLQSGVELDDGISKIGLTGHGRKWTVKLSEGRNRQIRRSFAALGYTVIKLHRTKVGKFNLPNIAPGSFVTIKPEDVI